MKICLIRPPIIVPLNQPMVLYTPPVGLAYVAGALRASDFDVQLIDGLGNDLDGVNRWDDDTFIHGMRLEEIVESIDPDSTIIGIHCGFTFDWPVSRGLIAMIRARFPETLLIAGGEHVNAMPAESLAESPLDLVVRGEGEETAVEIAKAVACGNLDFAEINGVAYRGADGALVKTPDRDRLRDIDKIPPPSWELTPIHSYLDRGYGYGVNRGRSMPIVASRGCPYQCTFCSNPQMWTTRWVIRNPDLLLDEIEGYMKRYQATNFDFYDLTFVLKKQWIIDFCRKIIERGLRITWQLPAGTRTEAIDKEVAEWLYKSGCRNMTFAPESGSPAVLDRIKKKISPDAMLRAASDCVSRGINVKVNMIFGFPGETVGEVYESYRFIARMAVAGADDLSIWGFSPYPGSHLFEELIAAGRIKIDAQYYDKLRTYSDASKTVSFCENMTDSRLKRLRLVGRIIFYLVSWGLRPWRPIRTLFNVFVDRPESRMDMGIQDLMRRRLPLWLTRSRSPGKPRPVSV